MELDFLSQLARMLPHGGAKAPLHEIPDRLLVKPPDLWAGEPEAGIALLNGSFTFHGQSYAFPDPLTLNIWTPPGMSAEWLAYLHSFSWLRDLRAIPGEDSARAGYTLIENWCRQKNRPDSADITGERLSNWISHADIFVHESNESFRDLFFSQLEHQALMLHKILSGPQTYGLSALKGLIYAGLALEGRESWIEQGLTLLEARISKEILKDGGHISRSPGMLLSIFTTLLDIRTALSYGDYPPVESLEAALERAGLALKFFRGGDGALASFHQTGKGHTDLLDQALSQAGITAKNFSSLPQSGYERLTLGRSCVLFDTGISAPPDHDQHTHAGPLAFEFSYGKETVFVNCGTHPVHREWREALRATPAHNTLTLAGVSAFDIKDSGHLGRKSRHAEARRMDGKDYQLAESSHDGYESLNGFIHKRRLYLGNKGHDLRGEDTLECTIGKQIKPHDFTIRFHIHPRTTASLIQNGREALLRLAGGVGWRFHHEGGCLSLEDSVVWGEGSAPRKTRQLVITGQTNERQTQIKWALQREGV